jgi:hypothetical protein
MENVLLKSIFLPMKSSCATNHQNSTCKSNLCAHFVFYVCGRGGLMDRAVGVLLPFWLFASFTYLLAENQSP